MKKGILLILTIAMCVFASAVLGASPSGSAVQITLLNQDPNPARAGDTVTLRFKVENVGNKDINNVNFELMEDYPFSVAGGSSLKTVKSISAYQNGDNYETLEYVVKVDKDAAQGAKSLKVKFSYDSEGFTSETFSVNIVNKEFAQIIYIDKAQLDPGRETDMKFTVINTGTAPLQNLVFSWSEPTGAILPVYSSDTKYVKYLEAGASVDLTYKVIADVNADPGLYQLNLVLNSESVTGTASNVITTKAGVFVGGETDFEVAFSESSAGQTSLSVANTGNNPAQSVSVKIPQQENFRVLGSNSAIIGNLDKGDYTLVSFQISSMSDMNFSSRAGTNSAGKTAGQSANMQNQQPIMPQTQNSAIRPRGNFTGGNGLIVEIDYTDTTGQRRVVTKNVPIQFRTTTTGTAGAYGQATATTSSSFIGSTNMWILIGVLVVLIFVFGKKERRQKIFGIFHKKK